MRLVRELGPSWDAVNADHMGLIRTFVEEHGGTLVRTEGDATFAVFPEARAAVAAAIDAQRAIEARPSPDGAPIRVRMGLHTGEAYLAGDDYGGFEVNRAARIAGAGHGGQILLSDSTRSLVVDALPPGVGVRDLGSHALRDVPAPERLYQLYVPGRAPNSPPCGPRRPVWANCRHGSRASSVARRMSLRSWHCWGRTGWSRSRGLVVSGRPASRWKRRA